MNIAIVGVGNVGRALGPRFADLGHAVTYAVRDPGAARHDALLAASPGATTASIAGATEGADLAVLCVPWAAARAAASELRLSADAVLVDATNPLTEGAGGIDPTAVPSGGQLVAQWSGSSKVVKAFNTTGSANMADPDYGPVRPAMLLAGDDPAANAFVADLASELGFDPVDIGRLDRSRALEEIALTWVQLAYARGNGPGIAFALLRR